jgi:hypothetical protein
LTLWPEFEELSRALTAHLDEITRQIIRDEVHEATQKVRFLMTFESVQKRAARCWCRGRSDARTAAMRPRVSQPGENRLTSIRPFARVVS